MKVWLCEPIITVTSKTVENVSAQGGAPLWTSLCYGLSAVSNTSFCWSFFGGSEQVWLFGGDELEELVVTKTFGRWGRGAILAASKEGTAGEVRGGARDERMQRVERSRVSPTEDR